MQLPAPQQVPVVENSLIIHCPPDCAVLNTIPSYSPPSDPSSCFFSAIRFVRRLRSTFRITTTMTTIRRINTQAVITSAFFSSAVKMLTKGEFADKVSAAKQERLQALYRQQELEAKQNEEPEVEEIQEPVEQVEVEVKEEKTEAEQVVVEQKPAPAQKTQTYINPDMVRRNNNREGGSRPQFDKPRQNNQGQNRGQGSQQGARPFPPRGRVEVAPPAPITAKTDNKKKKDYLTRR